MTEYSGSDWLGTARVIHNTMAEANAEAYICWAMVWNNTTSNSIIGVQFDGTYNVGDKYYTLKHYSKHIDKGYQRIETSGSTGNVKVSGYLSTDKASITLVVINKNTVAEQLSLSHTLTMTGVAGYQSVAGNFYQTMSGLDANNPIDLPAESLTTLVLTLSTPYNNPPAFTVDPITGANATKGIIYADTIAGSATDPDGDTLTYSKVSGPEWLKVASDGTLSGTPLSGDVGVNDFIVDVTDGVAVAIQAALKITVELTSMESYNAWAGGGFVNPFLDADPSSNPDGDSMNNLQEFAFGTDPTVNDSVSLVADGSVNGLPVTVSNDGGVTFEFIFLRRKDHGAAGSLTYTPQFSSDLVAYYNSEALPTLVPNSDGGADYEVVTVPYLGILPNGKEARFARVKVGEAP